MGSSLGVFIPVLEELKIKWPVELNNKVCYIYKTGDDNISIFVEGEKEPSNKIKVKYISSIFEFEKLYVHSNLYIFSCKATNINCKIDLQTLIAACDFT